MRASSFDPAPVALWLTSRVLMADKRDGVTIEERDQIKALERENRVLHQANEILRKASDYFAQAELVRRREFRNSTYCPRLVPLPKWPARRHVSPRDPDPACHDTTGDRGRARP